MQGRINSIIFRARVEIPLSGCSNKTDLLTVTCARVRFERGKVFITNSLAFLFYYLVARYVRTSVFCQKLKTFLVNFFLQRDPSHNFDIGQLVLLDVLSYIIVTLQCFNK